MYQVPLYVPQSSDKIRKEKIRIICKGNGEQKYWRTAWCKGRKHDVICEEEGADCKRQSHSV